MTESKLLTDVRNLAVTNAKSYKQCWINLGQVLVQIFEQKDYEMWGHKSFEEYSLKELGLKKSTAMNIVKNYNYAADWESQLLEPDYLAKCTPETYPDFDAMSVLRRVKANKHLTTDDKESIRRKIIDKHEPVAEVRKELGLLIKERKEVDSNEERDKKQNKSSKRFISEFKSFARDAEINKLLPADLIDKAEKLVKEIEEHLAE